MYKYQKIKSDILEQIKSGKIKVDERILSENEISQIYGVSLITSRRVLKDLEKEQFIYRVKGSGSFVAPFSINSENNFVALIVPGRHRNASNIMRIINGVQKNMHLENFDLHIDFTNDDLTSESNLLQKYYEKKVSGLIIYPINPDANPENFKKLNENNIPFVMIDKFPKNQIVDFVSSHNKDGAFSITNYVLQKGHRKLLFLSTNLEICSETDRLFGFQMALLEYDLQFTDNMLFNNPIEHFDDLVKKILSEKITALVCVNDFTAVNIIASLKKIGISVPNDISVTGFDDSELAKYVEPSLTTVRQNFERIGKSSAQILATKLKRHSSGKTQMLLPTELIIRESVKEIEN